MGLQRIFLSGWLYRLVRWGLAVLFVWAGVAKLVDPGSFGVVMDEFGLLPRGLIMPAAYALPVLEIGAGIGLAVDLRGSLGMIAGLLALFIAVLGYGIRLGLDVDCGCFGLFEPETSLFGKLKPALVRDLVMLLGVLYLYWARVMGVVFRAGNSPFFTPKSTRV